MIVLKKHFVYYQLFVEVITVLGYRNNQAITDEGVYRGPDPGPTKFLKVETF